MTAEDNGVPEDDDPFAYLYRGQEGEDPRTAAPQPGVPRTSYQQATQVGRTQYGPPRAQQPAGQPSAPPYQQQSYQQPQQQYQVPQQQAPQTSQPPVGGGRSKSRSGGSNRGVTYGAIGVAVAVVIGIGVAVADSGGTVKPSVASPGASQVASTGSGSASASSSATATAVLPGATNVSGMTLGGGAVVQSNHTGSASSDGKFVPLTASGMSVTWSNVMVPKAGSYYFWVHYANAGSTSADNFQLTVNGKALPNTINLTNWDNINDWNKAWQRSYSEGVALNAGSNTIELSYGSGSNAGVNVDQFAVTAGNNPPWP
jgi:hypothetical protein